VDRRVVWVRSWPSQDTATFVSDSHSIVRPRLSRESAGADQISDGQRQRQPYRGLLGDYVLTNLVGASKENRRLDCLSPSCWGLIRDWGPGYKCCPARVAQIQRWRSRDPNGDFGSARTRVASVERLLSHACLVGQKPGSGGLLPSLGASKHGAPDWPLRRSGRSYCRTCATQDCQASFLLSRVRPKQRACIAIDIMARYR
jgi:hypothetical protein